MGVITRGRMEPKNRRTGRGYLTWEMCWEPRQTDHIYIDPQRHVQWVTYLIQGSMIGHRL